MSPIGSYVSALTSKGRSVCSFGSTGGGCCTWLFHIKQKILDTTACFPLFQHTAFYFPPSSMVPLSLQRGKRAACFPFVELLNSYLYTKRSYAVSTPCAPKGAHRPAILMLRHRLKNPDRILADLQVVDLHRPCACPCFNYLLFL